jgi:hypothetical protein
MLETVVKEIISANSFETHATLMNEFGGIVVENNDWIQLFRKQPEKGHILNLDMLLNSENRIHKHIAGDLGLYLIARTNVELEDLVVDPNSKAELLKALVKENTKTLQDMKSKLDQ